MAARTAYTALDWEGAAVQTTLSSGISAGDTSIVLAASTGWPDGSSGHFFVVIDPTGVAEKVDVTSRSGTTLTVGARGVDGTSAASHAAGLAIYPVQPAVIDAESHTAAVKLLGQATAVGQVPVVDGANSVAMVQGKTSGQVLLGNGATVASTALSGDVTVNGSGVTAIGAGKVTAAMHNTTDFTAAGLALMDDATAAAQLTTLGLSAFVKTLMDDVDAAAFLTTLGISAFVQTILDDANAGAARTTLGVGTGDSPQFTALNVGHASDTTLARSGAGDLTVEGNQLYRAGGTDVAVADGGTGSSTAAAARTALGIPVYIPFSVSGNLGTSTGAIGFRCPVAMTIQHVRLNVGTAPTGAAILVDIHKNGTTVYSTQGNRPTIAISATTETATTAPDVTALAAGDVVTMDVDQVGSSVVGANLGVVVYCVAA